MPPQTRVQESQNQDRTPAKGTKYQANSFTITQLDGWQDKTIYTFTGPFTDGIQHSVVITMAQGLPFTSVREFAEGQIACSGQELRGCRLLKKCPIALANGTPAYQAIFTWCPVEGVKVYQEQIFVLAEGAAYMITASFSRATRKALGRHVEAMMLSFVPVKPQGKPQSVSR